MDRHLLPSARYAYFIRMMIVFLFLQTLTRVCLIFMSGVGLLTSLNVLFMGLIWDTSAWSLLGIPLYIACAFFPETLSEKATVKYTKYFLTFLGIFFVTFTAFCEITFWNEFKSRFNFIAVDYLIYTNEVIANINESYPMGVISTAVVILSAVLTWAAFKIKISTTTVSMIPQKFALPLFLLVLPLTLFFLAVPLLESLNTDFRKDQLARNGLVEFARAFRSNQIDFNSFYKTIDPNAVKNYISKRTDYQRPGTLQVLGKPNVVFIVVESLGAKFIAPLGGQTSTTPFLNQLSEESLFFENLYSTGTRTVRGLEAINLSIPPTPGYAVVKRPQHKNLYSLGNTFRSNGYDPVFLYGGQGFFDNMNSFFEGNGFRTIDQNDFSTEETTFSNAWGVCDEDLFEKALKVMDEGQRPKLLFLLTTSNHRPFTYPNGKIDIPSGESRAGAVKYTDYAIGKFLTKAASKTWMKNTVFVIVADHSTEGRGRFSLEMSDFHIPMWIYAPTMIKPARYKKLVSQIDIVPSLIHLLGLQDHSPFFGRSFFDPEQKEERAFIGNYQYVGYYKPNVLTTLGPNKQVRSYVYDPVTKVQKNSSDTTYLNEAIAYYQYANDLLTTGRYQRKEMLVTQRKN